MSLEKPLVQWMTERHRIYLKRASHSPWPWTKDPVLQKYKFTNVYRELDRTTHWFRVNFRDEWQHRDEVILGTIIFRWFNRIETGERLLSAGLLTKWNTRRAESVLRPFKPWTTGAYIISSPHGFDKLTGLCQYVDEVWSERKSIIKWFRKGQSLESAVNMLSGFRGLSGFMAYEIASDLSHTWALKYAPDKMTWANPGPGARRGLNRLHGRDVRARVPKAQLIQEMRELLPRCDKSLTKRGFPSLTMREIEHSLCEFDKYQRVLLGQGRPRGVYRNKEK